MKYLSKSNGKPQRELERIPETLEKPEDNSFLNDKLERKIYADNLEILINRIKGK